MNISDLKSKLQKSINHLKEELQKIRTGRASPTLVENLLVEAYDSKMTIREIASISISEAQTIVISPWDKTLLKPIDKAIREGDLNLNPTTDSDVVRVSIPQLTEERRKEFTKIASEKVEDCKRSIRNIRQDGMKAVDKLFLAKSISEDEKFTKRDEIEDLIKDFAKDAEELGESKRKQLMEI